MELKEITSAYDEATNTVKGDLDLRGTGVTEIPQGLNVKGTLNLRGCTGLTSLPELTVGGWLDLEGCTSLTSLPELTVGGWLNLQGTQITSLPDGLTVGGSLDLRGTQITDGSNYKKLQEGDYVEGRHLYADGILTRVAKTKTMPAGITYYVGKIKGHNVITDGKHYAHCKDVRSGILDLRFKQSDRDKSAFENLTLDSVINFDDAVIMYRVITGACSQGTQQFVDGLKEVKESYTVREIIEVTAGAYGNLEFAKFFSNK